MERTPVEKETLHQIAVLAKRKDFLTYSVRIVSAAFIGVALPLSWPGRCAVAALMLLPYIQCLGWPVALYMGYQTYQGGEDFWIMALLYFAMLAVDVASFFVKRSIDSEIEHLTDLVSPQTWRSLGVDVGSQSAHQPEPPAQAQYAPEVCKGIEASKLIWRYVAYSFQSDGIPNAEIAFRYGAYTYAILDILEKHDAAHVVRFQFSTSFAKADGRGEEDPLVKNLQAVVNKTIARLFEDNLDASSPADVRKILSAKAAVLKPEEAETFAVTDADCACFARDVHHLRHDAQELFAAEAPDQKQPERPQVQSEGVQEKKKHVELTPAKVLFVVFAVLGLAAISIHYMGTKEIAENAPYQTGAVLHSAPEPSLAPLKIETSGEGYYYFVLSRPGQNERYMTFFAIGGETLQVDVPLGTYELSYAFGKKWYGEDELFGEKTVYKKYDKELNFTVEDDHYKGYEIKMKTKNNDLFANSISPDDISQTDFPR